MNNAPSITSTESFAARAQRSEQRRVLIWTCTLTAVLLINIVRRLTGGIVMGSNSVFYPSMAVLGFALAVQVPLWLMLRRANRAGALLSGWIWQASAIFDICVPLVLLSILVSFSPRGPLEALSSPMLLMVPLVVMLSVLRLRPMFTLVIGLVATVLHLKLVALGVGHHRRSP